MSRANPLFERFLGVKTFRYPAPPGNVVVTVVLLVVEPGGSYVVKAAATPSQACTATHGKPLSRSRGMPLRPGRSGAGALPAMSPAATRRSHAPSIVDFITDPQLLGLSLSPAQEALQQAIYGLPLSRDHLELFHACTGRQRPPTGGFSEVAVIAGARAGKDSRIAAPIVVFEAVFGGHERHLARGERGVIPLVAQDARAAKIAYGYVRDYLTRSPMLSTLVDDVLASEIIAHEQSGHCDLPLYPAVSARLVDTGRRPR